MGNKSVNIVITPSVVLKANVVRPGWCINGYADADFRRPPYARSMKDTITDMNPGIVRINDGHNIDQSSIIFETRNGIYGGKVFASGFSMYPSNDPAISKPWKSPDAMTRGTLDIYETCNLAPKGSYIFCGLALNAMYAKLSGNAITYAANRETLLQNARDVVSLNLSANLGITHYEIGNETIGYDATTVAQAPNITVYIQDVQEFINTVKGIDPVVKVGANAFSIDQFKALTEGLTNVDFIIPHNYTPYGSPNTYAQYSTFGNVNLMNPTSRAVDGKNLANVDTSVKNSIQIFTTEASCIDFSPLTPYSWDNNLGLTLMTMDMIGQHISNSSVNGVCIWNTRGFVEGKDRAPHLLNPANELTPMGHGMSLWNKNFPNNGGFISASRDLSGTYVYSAANVDTTVVWLLNKRMANTYANCFVVGNLSCVGMETMTGKNYDDRDPKRGPVKMPTFTNYLNGQIANVYLPPVSVNVLQFGTYNPVWLPTANITVSSQEIAPLTKPGISMNYLLDSDTNRPVATPFRDAVKNLSPNHVRYPGDPTGFSWSNNYISPSAVLTRVSTKDFPSNNASFYTTPGVISYCVMSKGKPVVWIMNKTLTTKNTNVYIPRTMVVKSAFVFKGKTYTDKTPTLKPRTLPKFIGNKSLVDLPPVSITILSF